MRAHGRDAGAITCTQYSAAPYAITPHNSVVATSVAATRNSRSNPSW